ncbi:FAD-binding protein [Treponema vincentii]|uniref:FAD binding domain-containing protein n=1 Tax=Treponema vincentii TaxID=69710 RepID=UPI003D8F999E
MKNNYTVNTAKSMAELYTLLQNHTDITPLAGTTGLLKDCRTDRFILPESILLLKNIPELETIAKRERFIDFGAAATLNTILELGEKNVPAILYQAISLAANPGVRSLATIGGNIAQAPMQNSCLIPLLALDSKIEIRTRKETFWMPLIQYCDESSNILRHTPHIILRVRVPFEEWTISYYKRLGPIGHITADTASFVFLARAQKNLLSDIKLLFGSRQLIKSKEFENLLTGKGLPIDRRSVGALMKETEDIFNDTFSAAEISEFQKICFLNLIEESIYLLTN